MKILVLGSNGMAGHTITLYLMEQGYDVTAFTKRSFPYCNHNILGDAQNETKMRQILLSGRYDVVINSIGLLNQFAEENPSNAVFLNSYLPHFIADTLKDTPTKLIHMSTDCVFAGNTGPYAEHSFRDGGAFYDRTKALGEVDDSKNLTFRNSIIGPDINPQGIGLFNWFMMQRGQINGYTGAIWTGVTTLTLAKAMERAISEDLTGIYNLVNNESISKLDLLRLFNKHFRDGELVIRPDDRLRLDKTLICARQDFSFRVPSYEDMVLEMKQWIMDHKELYQY